MKGTEVLKAAEMQINGQRQKDYGKPERNLGIIAALWSDYKGIKFSPVDVAMMMSLLKIARVAGGGTDDCFIDLAGYAALGGEAFGEKKNDKNDQSSCVSGKQ